MNVTPDQEQAIRAAGFVRPGEQQQMTNQTLAQTNNFIDAVSNLRPDNTFAQTQMALAQIRNDIQVGQHIALADAYRAEVLPQEDFLNRPEFVETFIVERAAPGFLYMPWMRRVVIDTDSFKWARDVKSHSTDSNKADPGQMTELAEFPLRATENYEERSGRIERYGHSIAFSEDFILFTRNEFINLMNRKLERIAYWFTDMINVTAGNVLTNSYSTSQSGDDAIHVEAADTVWSSGSADPIKDIRDLAFTMETSEGDFVEPTDLWLTPENFRELNDYLDFTSQNWTLDPFTRRNVLNIDSIRVHRAPQSSGLPASTGIMLSNPETNPPITMYEHVDPNFSRTGILHVKRHLDEDNHATIFQYWKRFGIVLPNPKLVGMLHSL